MRVAEEKDVVAFVGFEVVELKAYEFTHGCGLERRLARGGGGWGGTIFCRWDALHTSINEVWTRGEHSGRAAGSAFEL